MNSVSPKISVICICYNHRPFVVESMESVFHQTYKNYELIVVDDGSTDGSPEVIEEFISTRPAIRFIRLGKNQGLCRAFNSALKYTTGDIIIDLAADDLLSPERLQRGAEILHGLPKEYGVIFSDAEWIDRQGNHLFFHSDRYPHATMPQGDIYKELIEHYFICSPTMMFKREVIETLGGYDESLMYEDFDFWIRSSRQFKYHYSQDIAVKKRKLKHSLSDNQFKLFSKQGNTTYRVCEKIMALNRTAAEKLALQRRIQYEFRVSVRTLNLLLAAKYILLWKRNKALRLP